jgi:hypothetical protein
MPVPTITTLPDFPVRGEDPTTFAEKANDSVAAYPTMVTQMNTMGEFVEDEAAAAEVSRIAAEAAETGAEAQVALAEAQVALAEAAADAAEAASNAEQWVSGQAYVTGEVVWSPINFKSYRANTNTSGTTDPSLSASWTPLSVSLPVSIANGGTGLTTLGTANQVLKVNSGGSALEYGAAASASLQEFTTSGTWTKPSGATFVMVEAWGAGGGGGSGSRKASATAKEGGIGGGGGAYAYRLFKASDLPSTVTATVGAGGSGGAAITVDATAGALGTDGGNTSFGSLLTSFGGAAGGNGGGGITSGAGGGVLSVSPGAGGTGGEPQFLSAAGSQAFGGGKVLTSDNSQASGFGGGGGGYGQANTSYNGGSSYQGGGGGGAGAALTTALYNLPSGSGGGITAANGTGGAGVVYPGATGTAGSGTTGGAGGAAGSAALFLAANNSVNIAFGNSTFAAVSTQGLIATSPNATTTWTWRAGPSNLEIAYILHDGTQFVVFNRNATRCWKTTDFTTYTEFTGLTTGISVTRVKYLNGNYFILSSSNGILWRSTDLVTWSFVNTGISTGIVYDICWTGTNYVVVGADPYVRYSSDLSTWSTPASGTGTVGYSCESNGSGVVVIHTGTNTFGIRSTDHGVNFSPIATTLISGAVALRGLFFGGSTWLLCANNSLWSSTDGNTWTARISASGDNMCGFAFDGTTFATASGTSNTKVCRTAVPASLGTWADQLVTGITGPGGTGGAGGSKGGGGGGGGGSLNGNNSGAGGAGGNGLMRVYTW